MKLGFIFNSQFGMQTVFHRPVPQMQSSVTYLGIELAKLGHEITVFSQTTNNIATFGVRWRAIEVINNNLRFSNAILEPDYDALIVINDSPEFLNIIKQSLNKPPKMFLWTEYDYNVAINKGLSNQEIVAQIDGIICVSEWQRFRFAELLFVPESKLNVIKHAISPLYENLFTDEKEFEEVKAQNIKLAYTAQTLQKLDILFNAYLDIENNFPDIQINFFAGNHKYGALNDQVDKLYPVASKLTHFNQIGSIAPMELAAQLRSHTILAYPCLLEETCNVPIMEALAAGIYVVTSNFGAIPEYCDEHGKCISEKNLHGDTLDSFSAQLLAICQTQIYSVAAFHEYCYKQTVDMNKQHTWHVRAKRWLQILSPPAANPANEAQSLPA